MAEPHVSVPLPEYIRDAAREAARTVISELVLNKDGPVEKLDGRLTVLETKFNYLLGAIVGSGALGGGVGALILKLLG